MANESPCHTLNATALVHEAYLRLVGPLGDRTFANQGHFFAAAAEAMRRILIDSARRKQARKRGGGLGPTPSKFARLSASAGEERIRGSTSTTPSRHLKISIIPRPS